jgi:hypothetical protein
MMMVGVMMTRDGCGGGGTSTVIASQSNSDVGRVEALGGGGAEETLTRAMLLPLLLIPTLTSFTRKSASENYVAEPLGIHRVGWIWLDVCRNDYDNNRCRGTTPTWRKPSSREDDACLYNGASILHRNHFHLRDG